MQINEHVLRLSGTAYLETELPRGKTLIIAAEMQETKREEVPNEDSTYNIIYTVKPLRVLERKEGGQSIPIKVKNRNSVRIRAAIMRAHSTLQKDGDAEQFYDKFADKLCQNPEAVINLLEL
jgi:hypothetical protein